MTQSEGGETVGPLAEVDYGPGFINGLRKLARFVIGPKIEPMDLSGLNDENDSPGLAIAPGAPTTVRELYSRIKELQDEGEIGPLMRHRGYGYMPEGSRSTVMFSGKGASIVDAARGLRARQEGKVPLWDGPHNPEAKRLLQEVDRQHKQKRVE